MGKKREIKIKVRGERRKEIDTRKMARAIIRLAVEMDVDRAQELADALEDQETRRHTDLRRARAERREHDAAADDRGAA
jgi:hypothetical protein